MGELFDKFDFNMVVHNCYHTPLAVLAAWQQHWIDQIQRNHNIIYHSEATEQEIHDAWCNYNEYLMKNMALNKYLNETKKDLSDYVIS